MCCTFCRRTCYIKRALKSRYTYWGYDLYTFRCHQLLPILLGLRNINSLWFHLRQKATLLALLLWCLFFLNKCLLLGLTLQYFIFLCLSLLTQSVSIATKFHLILNSIFMVIETVVDQGKQVIDSGIIILIIIFIVVVVQDVIQDIQSLWQIGPW